MEKRICNVLNELTVEEFLEIYSKSIQDRMSELGYYVSGGLICFDWEEITCEGEQKYYLMY